jgi:DNA gyrase inhibitor GyrI
MKYTLFTVLVSLLVSGCSALGQRYGEEALFATLFSDGDYEIRLYEPLIIAQTPAEGSYRQATRAGYNRLTDYVSGNNLAQQVISGSSVSGNRALGGSKVELTTPYYEEFINGFWLTSVALPEKYTLATLPRPANDLITFDALPRIKTAVISFSGLRSERLINQKADQLLQWIKQENLTAISAARSAIFDSPLALPGLRRHEIHISIR